MNKTLKDFAYCVSEKIPVENLSPSTYIGVDNLLKNRMGVTISVSVPDKGSATAFKKGDILIGNIRPYLKKIWLATFDGGCSNDVICIRSNGKLPNEFLYGVLLQDCFFDYDMSGSTGSRMPRGNRKHILNFPIPAIKETKKIGEIVGNITKKIQNNIDINKRLESVIRMIYNYWFLQFDFPDKDGNPYKSSGGKMIWSEDLQEKIPVGWKVENLFNNSLTEILESGINKFDSIKKYLATADVKKNSYSNGTNMTYNNKKSRANMQPVINSVWFALMKNSDKYLFISKSMDFFVNSVILSTGLLGLKCQDIAFEYIASIIASDYFAKTKDKLAHGATQQSIRKNDLKNIKILIPSNDVLKKFHKITENMYLRLGNSNVENEQLYSFRNDIISMLMSEQLKIK